MGATSATYPARDLLRPAGVVTALAVCVLAYGLAAAPVGRPPARSAPGTTAVTLSSGARLAVSRGLGALEHGYWVRRADSGLAAANPTQRFGVRFARGGVAVSVGAAVVRVTTSAIGRRGHMVRVGAVAPVAGGNRASYRRTGMVEWYANGPLGLEQGFTLAARPAGAGPVQLSVRLSGSLRPRAAGPDAITLHDASGHVALRYGGVTATDARGRTLPAELRVTGHAPTLSVDDRGARYPLRIDPLIQQAKLTSGTTSEQVGRSLAISGDTIAAGAPGYPGGTSQTGAVYVFVKPAGGWADTSSPAARLTDSASAASDDLGQSVAISGDTIVAGAHGNGYADVFVKPAGGWATTSTPDARLTDTAISGNTGFGQAVAISGNTVAVGNAADLGALGAAYVYVEPGGGWANATLPNATLEASPATTELGRSVAISGDTVVAGAPGWRDTSNVQKGAAFVFTAPGAGWGTGNQIVHQTAVLSGTNVNQVSGLGQSVATDGATIVAGAPNWQTSPGVNPGAAYLFEKPAGGWGDATQTAILTASDGANGDELGTSVGVSGPTVAAGTPRAGSAGQGAAYVYREPNTGWADAPESQKLTASDASANLEFGNSVGVDAGTVVSSGSDAAQLDGAVYVFAPVNPTITTSSLPAGTVGVAYTATVQATGGTPPYTWSATGLPAGLSLDPSTGEISGTPAANSDGSYTPTITVTDSASGTDLKQLALTIDPAAGPPPPPPPPPTKQVTLTVAVGGNGTGYVSSSAGTACEHRTARTAPTTCTYTVNSGTTVTLQAAPFGSSTFLGWFMVGGCISITADCTVTLTAGQSETALFSAPPVLTTNLTGNGTGAVSVPVSRLRATFRCQKTSASTVTQTCTEDYPSNANVSLIATPTNGSTFTGWSGACQGTGTCSVLMSADESVTAKFTYDPGVHVNAIELTQGVQTPELPTRSALAPSSGLRVAYSGVSLGWQNPGAPPVTTEVAQDHKTVVRVYVNTGLPRRGQPVPTLTLYALRDGKVLAPGPIGPDQPPPDSAVPVGSLGPNDYMNSTQRYDKNGAYTFTLPWGWAEGDVDFVADANPAPSHWPYCVAACQAQGIELQGVHFNPVTFATMDPIAVEDNALKPPANLPNGYSVTVRTPTGTTHVSAPDRDWTQVQAVTPFPIYVPGYKGTLDETKTIASNTPTNAAKQIIADLIAWANANDTSTAHYPFGIEPAADANLAGGLTKVPGVLYSKVQPISVAREVRPITSMAHEFNHGLGRLHAGNECGSGADAAADGAPGAPALDSTDDATNQLGEPWPPTLAGATDGSFDGVGLDTSSPSPYTVMHSTTATPFYDLMSYCGGTNDTGALDHWISVRNWNRDVEFNAPAQVSVLRLRSAGAARTTEASAQAVAAAGAGGYHTVLPASAGAVHSLAVTGVYDITSGTVSPLEVAPDASAPTPSAPGASYTLAARNASGQVVARAGLIAELLHFDYAPTAIALEGKIPARGVHEVDVLQGGRQVGSLRASAHAPTVVLRSPRLGARVGGPRGAVIRWRAHDADGGALTVTVRYSRDGGRTWRSIYTGPNRGSVAMPSGMLSASHNARVRVYVSDGFNEAVVTSPRFIAAGAPPSVVITSPDRGQRVESGGALDLAASAFDDAGTRLTGRALTWRAGGVLVAAGEQATAVDLAPGRHRLVVTARDHAGRTTIASVTVRILPSAPIIRVLRVPRRVSAKARAVTIRIATIGVVRLTVGRRVRATVGRRVLAVRVGIKPGRRTLALTLVLRSGRYVQRIPLRVSR